MAKRDQIRRIVCLQLSKLVDFDPNIVDEDEEPVAGVEQRSIDKLFKKMDQEDTASPPPKPRILVFRDRVKEDCRELGLPPFTLMPSQLIAFDTIGELVDHIDTQTDP